MSVAVAALGDSALLLPAAIALAGYLLLSGRRALGLAWLAALAVAGAATLAAKLVFHACGPALTDLDVVSPSGHTSFATVFYGALVLALGQGRPRAVRLALWTGWWLLVGAIAASRVRTGAHSGAEVAIGLALGLLGLAVFATLHGRIGRPALPWRPVAVGFAAALAVLGGAHLSLEGQIGRTARRLSVALDVCGPSGALTLGDARPAGPPGAPSR